MSLPDCSRWVSLAARALLVLASVGLASSAHAANDEPAQIDVRAFAGFGSGVGSEAWLPGRRVRLDVEAGTISPHDFEWGGAAVVVPLAGTPRRFIGVRAGYELEYTATDGAGWQGSRFAHAPDASAVVHLESAAGSSFEGQVGVEEVLRAEATVCCDDAALRTSSTGVRVALRGELALSPVWALFAQGSFRTADHLLEIKVLPLLSAGVRARF
jgi:hypothetical protein